MSTSIYTVHYRTENADSRTGLSGDAVFVKDGFVWPAFLFPAIWFAYKRMWIVLAIYVGFEIIVALAIEFIGFREEAIVIASLALNLIIGFEANTLYRWSLEQRRFNERAVVAADNLESAEFRFFAAHDARFDHAGHERRAGTGA